MVLFLTPILYSPPPPVLVEGAVGPTHKSLGIRAHVLVHVVYASLGEVG